MGRGEKHKARRGSRAAAMASIHQQRIEIPMRNLEAILDRVKGALSAEEFTALKGALETLEFLTRELEKKPPQRNAWAQFGSGRLPRV